MVSLPIRIVALTVAGARPLLILVASRRLALIH